MWTCGECRVTDGEVFYPCARCKRGRFHKKCTVFMEGTVEYNGTLQGTGVKLVCKTCAAELLVAFNHRQVGR